MGDRSRSLHPSLTAEQRRRLLRLGVDHFNAGRFFEAHEAWEEIWRSNLSEPRELFRGLIQIAVGLHHYRERGRAEPAHRVLTRGLYRLDRFPAAAGGIDLEALRREARNWAGWLQGAAGGAGTEDSAAPPLPRVRLLAEGGTGTASGAER